MSSIGGWLESRHRSLTRLMDVERTMARWAMDRDRARAAALTGLSVAGLGYALIAGLDVSLPIKPVDVMKLFSINAPRPPEPREQPPPPHPRHAEREGASAPPNRRSTATPVVAPIPIVPLTRPPPMAAAPIAATGADASSGAALVAGPGTGAGGIGNGLGSGRFGYGRGDGGSPARVVRKIQFTDLRGDVRRALADNSQDYAVGLRFTVGTNGRVTDCAVTRSSGYPALDAATCQAALAKIRYTPERDAGGRPIAVVFTGTQEWPARRGDNRDGEPDDD